MEAKKKSSKNANNEEHRKCVAAVPAVNDLFQPFRLPSVSLNAHKYCDYL